MCLILDYIWRVTKARARQMNPACLFNPANEKSTGAVPLASSAAMERLDSAQSQQTQTSPSAELYIIHEEEPPRAGRISASVLRRPGRFRLTCSSQALFIFTGFTLLT